MSSTIRYTITPQELVQQQGWRLAGRQTSKWIVLRRCPMCGGGQHGDEGTFIIHTTDGNYSCKRETCGARGTFWGLLLHCGLEPRDYIDREDAGYQPNRKPTTSSRYVYSRRYAE